MFFTSKQQFQFEDIPDLFGKVAIITGASAGLGKVSALEMARKNCEIIFACRNKEKTEAVIQDIKEQTGNNKLKFIEVNMASLASVQTFIAEINSRYSQIDILLNNAGLATAPTPFSKDGINYHFAVNHVAHHYLTVSLLPLLQKSESARVVTVSSGAHAFASSLYLDEINTEAYVGKFASYGISKAANILFTRELAKRLKGKGIENVYANSNHPGVSATDVYDYGSKNGTFFNRLFFRIVWLFATPVEEGALTQVYLSTSPDIEKNNIKGQYYVPTAEPAAPSKLCSSDEEALALWNYTENLIKEKIPDYPGANI